MPDLRGKYPPMYNAERYRKRYDAFTPQQMQEAWSSSGQLPPVDVQSIYNDQLPVDQPVQPAPAAPQFQAPSNPYPALSPEHRMFREMEASGDIQGIQRLLQQSVPQATGLFGM